MERIQALIDKLVRQQQENQDAAQLLITVQMLQAELQLQQSAQAPTQVQPARSRIAVTLPAGYGLKEVAPAIPAVVEQKPAAVEEEKIVPTREVPQPPPPSFTAKPVEVPAKDQPYIPRIPTPSQPDKPYSLRKPVWLQEEQKPEVPAQPVPQPDLFTPRPAEEPVNPVRAEVVTRATVQPREHVMPELKEFKPAAPSPSPQQSPMQNPAFAQTDAPSPVLAQHDQPREVQDAFAKPSSSLNDLLKQQKTELVSTLQETPIKDLRKGVGINDRFSFVNELFRGDEAMYERSIKTINGFHILAEAEYWINRELKFKLGWNDTTETVQRFYGLVRRRFA